MKTILVMLTKGNDDFGAWVVGIKGIYGAGETPNDAKKSIEAAIRLYIKHNEKVPAALKGKYELVFKMDAESLLTYYRDIFTKPGLEKITGINQKQLHHYATGLKKPRAAQSKKIASALHLLGKELLSVEL
jgi:predicted RNase H-like HicB family nuclease